MHILFVHQKYPAQFGHLAKRLAALPGFKCTFLTRDPPAYDGTVERVNYVVRSGARNTTHHLSRAFENQTWHSAGIIDALRGRPDIKPDVVVTHSGFFHSVCLKELLNTRLICYFEYFFRTSGSHCHARLDLPGARDHAVDGAMRLRARNASFLLDLDGCDAGYSPIEWQRQALPKQYHSKVRRLFDGIDTRVWANRASDRRIGELELPADLPIVTYVARGLEPLRGFDMFMRAAKIISNARKDVVFVVVGKDKIFYGADTRFLGGKTFKEWVLAQDDYDLTRFRFVEWLEPADLAKLFSLSSLHFYLTMPYVLSWSLFNALSCGALVLGSSGGPVEEVIKDGWNGLLEPFSDVEALAARALDVLDDPAAFDELRRRARRTIEEKYSVKVCLPQIRKLIEDTARGSEPGGQLDDDIIPTVPARRAGVDFASLVKGDRRIK